jgi:hypothetical protein
LQPLPEPRGEGDQRGREPEPPARLSYGTADGRPVPGGWLLVRKGDRTLFVDRLEDGRGEIALIPSDAPYALALRRNTTEDAVAEPFEPPQGTIPLVLESTTLGIGIVLTAIPPPSKTRPGLPPR